MLLSAADLHFYQKRLKNFSRSFESFISHNEFSKHYFLYVEKYNWFSLNWSCGESTKYYILVYFILFLLALFLPQEKDANSITMKSYWRLIFWCIPLTAHLWTLKMLSPKIFNNPTSDSGLISKIYRNSRS